MLSEDEVKPGVDDGVEDGIDVAVGVNEGGEAVFVSGQRADILQVQGLVQVGVFIWVFKLGCSSLRVQVGVLRSWRFVNSWFPFFDEVSLPATSR
jgi:hypothetical protein